LRCCDWCCAVCVHRYEATHSLSLKPRVVQGTFGPFEGHKLSEKIAIVPILRGGLGMVSRLTRPQWH
jgi:uracil phosphoribosyltransferase